LVTVAHRRTGSATGNNETAFGRHGRPRQALPDLLLGRLAERRADE
jgi:hypothetical protein